MVADPVTMRGGAWAAVTAIAAAVLATVPALPAQARVEAAPEVHERPADGTYNLTGRGFGHGRGLSQYGSKSRGEAGQTWRTITSTYYPGTARANEPDAAIRVALTNAGAEGTGRQCDYSMTGKANCGLVVLPQTGLHVAWLQSGAASRTLPAKLGGLTVTAWGIKPTTDQLRIQLMAKTSAGWQAYLGSHATGYSFDRSGTTRLRYVDGTVTDYNGSIEARRTGPTTLLRINSVMMERYLRGVVPREMPAGWDADALNAQAVAARTYATNDRENGSSVDQTCDSTACQVYRGERATLPSGSVVQAEASTNAAIVATAEWIRTYNGEPAFTQFSASNGGQMAAGSQPYLTFGPDSFDHYPQWTAGLTVAKLQSTYPALGHLDRMIVTRDGRGALFGGRILTVRLEGTRAGVPTAQNLTGDQLRTLGGLRSTYFGIGS